MKLQDRVLVRFDPPPGSPRGTICTYEAGTICFLDKCQVNVRLDSGRVVPLDRNSGRVLPGLH